MPGEEIFLPRSVAMHAALSPPYSPYPLNDVLEDDEDASDLVLPDQVDGKLAFEDKANPPIPLIITGTQPHVEPGSLKRKKRSRKLKYSKSVGSEAHCYIRQRSSCSHIDVYYDQRFLPYIGLDSGICLLLEIFGNDFFTNKSVLCVDCGAGLVPFQLAALFQVSRVIGTERDVNSVLENCAQLRKFKHDGIDVWDENSETANYPKLLLRRTGPVRVTNKPWLLGDRLLNDHFPFNLEFRYLPTGEAWKDKADIVISHNHERPVNENVHAEGYLVYLGKMSSNLPAPGFAKRHSSRSLHVYQRIA